MILKCYFASPEFMEDRARFAAEIFEKAMCIKDRTIRCNYASAYAVRLHLR